MNDTRTEAFATWETVAGGWERWRDAIEEATAPIRDWMLGELNPQPGDTLLELAAGPGGVGFAAAAAVGPSGRVISTDFSPAMVEIARRGSAALGLVNVEHRVMDAERIDLADDSVDGVLCRCGYMLMPDPAAALAETRRVLKAGGRVALATWREAERNPWISIVGRKLLEQGRIPPPVRGEPGIFALARDQRIRELLEGAGFGVRRIEDVPVRFVYESLDEYIERARDTGGVFAKVWQELSDTERDDLESELDDAFAPFAVADGYDFPGLAVAASAE